MTPTRPIRRIELAGASVEVFSDEYTAATAAARFLADLIREKVEAGGSTVLGLATGSTPIPVYGRLVSFVQAGSLSFERVTTFNLDEYYPMGPLDPNSYRSFMHRHLFSHVDLAPNRAHLLDGTVPEGFAAQHAADFDRWIKAAGGLDLQLLGLGRNGHIGFNEPSHLPVEEAVALPTRVVELHPHTITDAAKDFGGEDGVPRRALTMGVAPILAARSILILAFGSHKAPAVAKSLLGPITAEVPGSLLRKAAGRVTWMLDPASAAELGG
jgi:glucosamine-6-phosphate deaminase